MTEGTDALDGARFWERLPETPVDVDFRQHRIELNRTLRAAFIAGAEEQSLTDHGRRLTADELRLVMAEYPGDLPTAPVTERD
jgi:hypothetical protein